MQIKEKSPLRDLMNILKVKEYEHYFVNNFGSAVAQYCKHKLEALQS